MNTPVLVVGEALIDIVVPFGRPDEAAEHVGGSPANVVVGLARLGHAAQFATHIGPDARGRRIAALMAENGVSLSPGSQTAERTSTATARLDAAGVASYDFDVTWDLEPGLAAPPDGHLHTGSIGAAVAPGGPKVVDLVRAARATATVSYDPNARPSLMADDVRTRRDMETLIALSDVVKASDEDLAWLYPTSTLDQAMCALLEFRPPVAVVTRGGADLLVLVRGERHTVPAQTVEVVDTVGAGDTFMGALISGLLDAGLLGGVAARERLASATWADIRPAVVRAVDAAAINCSRAGANPPTRAELTAASR